MRKGKLKLQFRIRPALGREMAAFAAKERRELDDLAEQLTEWAFEQLKAAGSLNSLYRYKIRQKT